MIGQEKKNDKCGIVEMDSRTLKSICKSPPTISPYASQGDRA